MVARKQYLDQLIDSMWDGQVKVITGIRRCGKSVTEMKDAGDYDVVITGIGHYDGSVTQGREE